MLEKAAEMSIQSLVTLAPGLIKLSPAEDKKRDKNNANKDKNKAGQGGGGGGGFTPQFMQDTTLRWDGEEEEKKKKRADAAA